VYCNLKTLNLCCLLFIEVIYAYLRYTYLRYDY